MYHSYFGKLGQLRFPKPEDYYRFLGYLAHANIKVVYEPINWKVTFIMLVLKYWMIIKN